MNKDYLFKNNRIEILKDVIGHFVYIDWLNKISKEHKDKNKAFFDNEDEMIASLYSYVEKINEKIDIK